MTMTDSTPANNARGVTASGLPTAFADLEPFAAWILATQPERYARRLTATMAEMQSFYDLAFPRLAEILEYCDEYPVGELPDDVKRLMHLVFSLIEVSFPIEIWKQGRVPDSGAAAMNCILEPAL